MKRFVIVLVALLAATLAHAQLDELKVRLVPGVSEIPEGWRVQAYVQANSNRAIYRADLARREGGVFVTLPDDAGHYLYVSGPTGQIVAHGLPPGEYRLRTYASEGPGTPELMVSNRFRVVASTAADLQVVSDRYWITYAYEGTLGCWQDYVADLRKRHFLMADLARYFEAVPPSPVDCRVSDPRFGAPGGGEPVITGEPGDGDATGAVVVTAHGLPTGPDDLRNLDVSVTLPAYPGVPGLTRRTQRVAWEPGIADPVTAISNLSLSLFPSSAVYALDGTPIPMWARVEGGKAAFAFELERWNGTAYVHVKSWQGDSMVHWQPRWAGRYRLRVSATEEGASTVLQTTRLFRVIGPENPDYDRVRVQNTVDRNFERTLAYVRNQIYSVKRFLARQLDVSQQFKNMSSGWALQFAELNWLEVWELAAPGGGSALLGGVAGDGDATGAIVIDVEVPPNATDDWEDTTVHVTYPAYAPIGSQQRTVTLQIR